MVDGRCLHQAVGAVRIARSSSRAEGIAGKKGPSPHEGGVGSSSHRSSTVSALHGALTTARERGVLWPGREARLLALLVLAKDEQCDLGRCIRPYRQLGRADTTGNEEPVRADSMQA